MAAPTGKKPSVAIPVRVTNDHAVSPVAPPVQLPPTSTNTVTPPARPVQPIMKKIPAAVKNTVSEPGRRKIMWVTVTVLMIGVITAWAALWHLEFQPGGSPNIFSQIHNMLKNFSVNQQATTTSINPEVRDLSKQIFPQFESVQ